ncbi:hypothetical protein ZIOFF_013683 [Zingiber officinale]|uniref:Bacterial Ig-like domain-containing protein n=1 Tax=Zingiber officinale TaxID=94328 RepID=A0A8J5HG49_ZINOF|nr:hypothetical protein ZIOFF_013683 [Zingiber officinale]
MERPLWLLLLASSVVVAVMSQETHADGRSDASVEFLKTPPPFSASSSATFQFEVTNGRNGSSCRSCSITCKLDNYSYSACESKDITYSGLLDGNHIFEVCINGSRRVRCASYNWTVGIIIYTIAPTAYISSDSFTNSLNVWVNISFSEPCINGGEFRCSPSHCNLLSYGAGRIVPSTLKVLLPNREFSIMVDISAEVQFGRLLLVMDKGFCKDDAGNIFKRTSNSSFIVHFDRRSVSMNITSHLPLKFLQLHGQNRIAEATNSVTDLRIYLTFSVPVVNSSEEILSLLHASNGLLVPTNKRNLNNRRFGYQVRNISTTTVVTVSCDAVHIISRQGTPISPTYPFTFLFDNQRPSVRLSTNSSTRTRHHKILVLIEFLKPVFNFSASAIVISGGYILRFQEMERSTYLTEIQTNDSTITVEIPENKTTDIAGNRNLASNLLQVKHYTTPAISSWISRVSTVAFAMASVVAALLSVSTTSLLTSGAISRPKSSLVSEPTRNLLRFVCHIQVFALSRWLLTTIPIEYYEFSRSIAWSIPYINLPWESVSTPLAEYSSDRFGRYSEAWGSAKLNFEPPTPPNQIMEMDPSFNGKPLTPEDYMSFLENQNMRAGAEFINVPQTSYRWTYFGRNIFWLAVFSGGLILLHMAILCFLKWKKNLENQKEFGALVFPRLEIFLIMLALPCISQASVVIIKGKTTAGVIIGILLLSISTCFLISLLLLLSIGITMGKLLQYKEVHKEGQKFHWYHELIRITLGPGKRGQWTWKDQANSLNLIKLGPLFEDLRGPPKYMLTQISGGGNQGKQDDRIIASDDENEDAEAPIIQKLFGILRIYYTLLESVKRISLGILAGAHSASSPSRVPILIVLSITSFQLFFMVLKKPFIKKKLQLVEIISVASEVGLFGAFLALLEKDFSDADEGVGIFMLAMFVIMFTAQLVNELYALYRQVIRLSPARDSFSSGLKSVFGGLLLIVLPTCLSTKITEQLSSRNRENGITLHPPPSEVQRTSGTSELSWLRQLRAFAKGSFSREDRGGAPSDPSTSAPRRSSFWTGKRSRSSSVTSSSDNKEKGDSKSKSRGLYKDLEKIFSSN